MKKLLIIFSIFTITTLPAMALDIDFDSLRASFDNTLISKYCTGGGRIDCTVNKTTGSYSLSCSAQKPNIDQEQMKADLKAYCENRMASNRQETDEPESKRPTQTGATTSAETTTVSGTVLDENNNAMGYVTVAIPGTTKGTTTDANGKFELKDVPSDATIEISYVGYKDQTVSPGTNLNIKMEVDAIAIDAAVVVGCGGDKANGIKSKERIDGECYPSACVEPRWTLSGTGKRAKCVEQKCTIDNGAGEWTADGDTWKCALTSCKKGYDKNGSGDTCIEQLTKCSDAQIQQHPNATKTGLKKGTQTCIAQDCKCGFKLENDACVAWSENEQCTADTKPQLPGNAKSGIMKCDGTKAYCEISDCNDGYKVSGDKKSCLSTRGDDCDATAVDPNATAGTTKNVKGKMTCVITDCARGFAPNKDGTKCVAGELSEADSQAKIDELRDNADAMKAKEQSTANKLLGAAGIGATGIGGMQMASAMAEEKADADAEQAMRAYLATFHCNYGAGKNIPGGERDVELPGGNELIGLYAEYVNLANDLKIRKTALDMRPGIESESILDAATSGLYDDVAIGKTSGAYTSLARALMDPNGADAAAWAAQKAETADKKKTGMITAGIGAAGSLVGNLAINSGKDKQNKVNEILNKYDKKKQLLDELESDVAAIPPQTAPCPNGTTGTAHPDCTCNDTTKIYNPNTHACEACIGGQIVKDGACTCPADKPLWDTQNSQCIAKPTTCTPQCTPTEGSHLQVLQNCSCSCTNGYTYEDGQCTCTGENKQIGTDGTCQTIETKTIVEHISTLTTTTVENASLPAGSLFKIGSYELVDAAKQALNNFITGLSNAGYQNCKITVDGYTDPTGGEKTNKTLSQNRANAVKTYIETLQNSAIESVTATGYGETKCTCGAGKSETDTANTINGQTINYSDREYKVCSGKDNNHTLTGDVHYAPCRRVEITADCKQITTVTQQQ